MNAELAGGPGAVASVLLEYQGDELALEFAEGLRQPDPALHKLLDELVHLTVHATCSAPPCRQDPGTKTLQAHPLAWRPEASRSFDYQQYALRVGVV